MKSDVLFLIAATTALVGFLSLMVLFVLFLYRNAKRRHELTERHLKSEFEAELLRTELEIAEEVNNKLSQELHDDLGQLMAHAIHLHQQNKQHELGEMLQTLRIHTRNISHNLHNAKITEVGLDLAIEKLCNTTYASYSPPCTYTSTDAHLPLSPQEEIVLFRCVQQALSNVYQHAQANHIQVALNRVNDHLVLEISDNGVGFDPNQAPGGLGLISLQNRVKMIKAELEIQSKPQQGTIIRITKNLVNHVSN